MINKKIIKTAALFLCLLLVFSSFFTVAAKPTTNVPYIGYEYNSNEKSVAAPVGYYYSGRIDGGNMGLTVPLNSPNDLFFGKDGLIYLLDSGNSRVIVLNKEWKTVRIIENITDESGETYDFTDAGGVTADQSGGVYIADTQHQRVLVLSADGGLKMVLHKPETSILDEGLSCNFIKVLTDEQGRIYALADDVNIGAMVYLPDGSFHTFYGSNPVTKTADVIKKYLLRRFMSEKQLKGSLQYTSVNFSNFDTAGGEFIYTVTKDQSTAELTEGMVRKLNVAGSDILNQDESIPFGDIEYSTTKRVETGTTKFIDIDVDSEGFMFLLDETRGRVFVYSQQNGMMLTAFGGSGTQDGMFGNPRALETADGIVYVLDKENNCIYSFEPTDYMQTYRSGVIKLEAGDYNGAEDIFNEILAYNTNNETAYYGIGKCLDAKGDYKGAMENFKKAYNNTEYSKSFEQYRKFFIREHFTAIIIGIFLLVMVIAFAVIKLKKAMVAKEGSAYNGWETKRLFPFYTARHPVDGFAQFRDRNIMSYAVAAVLLVIWFLLSVISYFYMGFPFNTNRAENYRLIYTVLQTVGVFILFIIANYAICTLLEGKGKFKEIFCAVAYCLLPMLICKAIGIVMSQFMAENEGTFISIVVWVGILWSAILLFMALSTVHQYSFGKTIVSILLTLFGMCVILFLIILFYSLLSQLMTFLQSLATEISLR